jgi:thiol-disulfide isomerase/thioredoxin
MIVLTHADIGRLTVANPKQLTAADSSFILGRLEFPGGKLTGRLVDTEGRSEPTPLRFAPRGSDPVNLATSFQGRIVYRDTPKQTPESAKDRRVREQREAALERANQRRGNQGGLWNAFTRAFGNNGADVVAAPAPRSMHLRSGEIIPCEVSSIDENGVVFASEVTKQTRLPQNQVRAIAFTVGCRDPEIEATRRDRLLTVPRIRKKNRPTHLIVAVNDDIMRCRLVEMNQKSLIVESRLEKIEISRDVVAQIIFLDDREVDEDEPQAADAVQQPVDLAVRAILRNGNRMSLFARSLKDSMLIGEHPLLGESKLKLGDVDQLLIGIDINEAGVDQPYGGWRLQDAPEPIIPEAGSAGSGSAVSPLVGKEAPDFRLDLLDGGKFSVAEARGQVLVLDFWATWCGPCLQAMPMIEEAVSTFDDKQVRLIAVNLQEPVEPIRGVLKRLGISPEVALDIDGVAAARYQADAIPQTVVIDREGKIAHLFVGGGPNFGEQLRAAIAETVEKKP